MATGLRGLGTPEHHIPYRVTAVDYENMVGVAKSQALKKQILRKEADDLKAHAVGFYAAEDRRILEPGQKKKSLRQICKDASDAHFEATGRRIHLAHLM